MKGVLGMISSRVPGTRPGRPEDFRKQQLNAVHDVKHDPSSQRVVFCDIVSKVSSGRQWLQATTGYSFRRALGRRPLLFTVPGVNPFPATLMRNSLTALKRSHSSLNPGDLPLVQIQIFVDRLGGEERSASPGALG